MFYPFMRFRRIFGGLLFLLLVHPLPLVGQSPTSLEGRVVDGETNSPLPGVHVLLETTRYGSVTDADGQFRLTDIAPGDYVLIARFVGYETYRRPVGIGAGVNEPIEIRLQPAEILLDDVIVSATRERQLRTDVAASIGSVSSDDIDDIQPTHPGDIMGRIPGVWVNQTGGEGHMTAIRQPLSTEPLYLFLENGVPTRSTGFFNHNALYEINIPQADHIEVIKGPGTALYGSDAIGGVIDVSSRPAPTTPTFSSTLEGGSYGFMRALVSGGTSLGRDGLRLDLNITESDGWRDATEYSRQSATLRWDRRVGSATLVRTVASFSNIDQKPAGSASISEEDYRSDPTLNYQPISFRDVQALRISTAVERQTGSTLLSMTPYFRYNTMDLLPNWSLTFDPAVWETQNYSVGMQLRGRRDFEPMRSRVVAGADLDLSPGSRLETQLDPVREGKIFISAEEIGSLYDYDVTYRQASPYVHGEISPVPAVRVSGGLRLDVMGYDYSNKLSAVDDGRHRRPPSMTRTYSHLSPKLGLTAQVTPGLNAFASYRHAFRVPSESQLFRQGSTANTVDLEPVKVDNFEVGLRGRPARRMTFETAAYSMTKTDDIVGFVNEDGTTSSVNAGETSHRGVEAGVTLEPLTGLTLSTAYSYAVHRYEDWKTSAGDDLGGNEMEVAPRVIATTSAEYDFDVLRGGTIALEWSRLGTYWMDPENSSKYDGHDILDLRVAVNLLENVSLLTRVSNVTDVLYADRATYNAFRGDEFSPGAPRSVYVSLKYRFD